MTEKIEHEPISRRQAFSLFGATAAFSLAIPVTLSALSEAQAQTPGMERREDRREDVRNGAKTGAMIVKNGAKIGKKGVKSGVTTGVAARPLPALPARPTTSSLVRAELNLAAYPDQRAAGCASFLS